MVGGRILKEWGRGRERGGKGITHCYEPYLKCISLNIFAHTFFNIVCEVEGYFYTKFLQYNCFYKIYCFSTVKYLIKYYRNENS